MESKKKQIAVGALGVFVGVLLIWLIVVGCNLFKNRWHKVDFNIDSITVTKTVGENPYEGSYYVTVKGSAKAWFYDNNEYQFDLIPGASGDYYPSFYQKTDTLTVSNKEKTPFQFSFSTKEYMDEDCIDTVCHFVYAAENINVNGSPDSSHDIRLFLTEFKDKIIIKN